MLVEKNCKGITVYSKHFRDCTRPQKCHSKTTFMTQFRTSLNLFSIQAHKEQKFYRSINCYYFI
jgi:hypothetical protein